MQQWLLCMVVFRHEACVINGFELKSAAGNACLTLVSKIFSGFCFD